MDVEDFLDPVPTRRAPRVAECNAISEALRQEVLEDGVRVTVV